jgi:cyclopropane fatty-acyl-phospholipid synthase-like methyltransferase
MTHKLTSIVVSVALAIAGAHGAQESSAEQAQQVKQERAQAELDAPKLVEQLELKPGMTVADVGAGGGAMTVVLGKWIGSGHVFATDIGARQLGLIRDYVKREGLSNVTVLEGAAASTNLPEACCDAIFLRLVYHHIKEIEPFNKSLYASLKPGGRLAIIDFVPTKGSQIPEGVPANREGHGIPMALVISEVSAPGLTYVKTIEKWPPGEKNPPGFLVLFRRP